MELKRKIVLLVDDEESVRTLVKGYLESLGVYVLVADGAPAAIRLAQASPLHIDLLVTDVLLPYVNGRDLANRISQLRPDLKVLFISGYPIEVLESHGLCSSRAELLLKPFSRADLADKVRQVIETGAPWTGISRTTVRAVTRDASPRGTEPAGRGLAVQEQGLSVRSAFQAPPVQGP